MQETRAPEQDGALAAVRRHLGDGYFVGQQTRHDAVYLTAATSFAVAVFGTITKVKRYDSINDVAFISSTELLFFVFHKA